MKKSIVTAIVALGLSSTVAMAGSMSQYNAPMHNPYAQSNAQIQGEQVQVEKVASGASLNKKVVNPLYKYTGQSTESNVTVANTGVQVSH